MHFYSLYKMINCKPNPGASEGTPVEHKPMAEILTEENRGPCCGSEGKLKSTVSITRRGMHCKLFKRRRDDKKIDD